MNTIVQDYKNYRNAKKAQENIESDLNRKLKSIVKPISLSELSRYHCTLGLLTTYAKSFEKDVNALEKYMKEKAPLVHAPSCFCMVSVGFYLCPGSILEAIVASEIIKEERDKEIKKNDVIRCIHNHEDGTIDENCCSNCPKEMFHDLVEYQSLRGQYTDAQKATIQARRTLFVHFPFIKQKTSH
ncbi:MAG: hypothetical protein J6Y07_00990 [Alphaproteobacteria bacterium]|nr:hypothetical protein [Alphaproteobacteria bacterium]